MKIIGKWNRAAYLDEVLPLAGASHADVVRYGIDIPMRYAECYATLADGRNVRLRNSRNFLGWSDSHLSRRLLFRSGGRHIVLDANARRRAACNLGATEKFIACDGSLLTLGPRNRGRVADRAQRLDLSVLRGAVFMPST